MCRSYFKKFYLNNECKFDFTFVLHKKIYLSKAQIYYFGSSESRNNIISRYFTKIGLKSAHYIANNEPVAYSIYKAKKEKKPIFYYLQSFDALTEMNFDSNYRNIFNCYYPQIDDFKQILDENPDSVYILNSRDINKQVQSIAKISIY